MKEVTELGIFDPDKIAREILAPACCLSSDTKMAIIQILQDERERVIRQHKKDWARLSEQEKAAMKGITFLDTDGENIKDFIKEVESLPTCRNQETK